MGDTWEGKCLEKIMYTNLKFTMSDNSDVLKGLDEEAYNACANATSFRQFLDAHHRFAGFATPDLYFKHICPRKKGPFITIPTLMVASADAETTTLSTGENLTHHTPRLCPLQVSASAPVSTCHILTVRSCDPEATMASLGDTASELMSLSCAFHPRNDALVCANSSGRVHVFR